MLDTTTGVLLLAAAGLLGLLPIAMKKETAARLEEEVPIFLGYIYARLEAGWSLKKALEAAAREEKLLSAFHREVGKILREAEVKGDLPAALLDYKCPSKRVTNILRSLGEEAYTGFDPASRVGVLLWDEEEYAAERARKKSESAENLAEASMMIMILIPLFISFTAMFGGSMELIFPIAAISSIITYVAALALQGVPMIMLSTKTKKIIYIQGAVIGLTVFLALPIRTPQPLDPWLFLGLGAALIASSIPASYEVRRAIGEMEGGHLLAQGLAVKLELGYPLHRSFQMVKDGRVAEQIRRISVGVDVDPRSKQLQLVLSTIKVVKDSGAGAKALEVVARTAQRLYHAYRDLRARLRFYELISIGAGPIVLAMSYAITRPLKEFASRYAATAARSGMLQPNMLIFGQPTLSGLGKVLLPVSVILSLILGLAVSKLCDHTVATTWRAGAGVITATLIYLLLSPYW